MNALFAEASKFSSFDVLLTKDVHLFFSPVNNSRFLGVMPGKGGRGGKGIACHFGLLGRVVILVVTSYYGNLVMLWLCGISVAHVQAYLYLAWQRL